jgi:serine/threonine-protein kinase
VAIAPNGRYAYIANRAAGVVTVLDLTIDKVISTIPIQAGPPQYIAFAPDGNHAYVSIYNDPKTINLVAVLDTRTTRVLQTIPVKQKPYALAVTPDQRFVYVPSHDAGAIDIIDVGTNTVVDSVDVLPNPHWVTFSPDGKLAYIANHEEECLKPVDPKSRVEAPGGRTFPISRQVPQARPACQRRSGRYARVHGSCSGRIGEVGGRGFGVVVGWVGP